MAELVLLQFCLTEQLVTTDSTLRVLLPVLQQVGVPEELMAAQNTDGMRLEVFPQTGLGTEAVVAEDAEQRTVGWVGSLNPRESLEVERTAQHVIVVNQDLSSLDVRVDVAVVVAHIRALRLRLLLLGKTPPTSGLRGSSESKPPEDVRGTLHLVLPPVEKTDQLAEFLVVHLGEDQDGVLLQDWSGEEDLLQELGETGEQGQVPGE